MNLDTKTTPNHAQTAPVGSPEPPELKLDDHQRLRFEGIPIRYRTAWARAVTGSASPRQAIKAKCQDCCGWEEVIESVKNCAVKTCPVWYYRPYQEKRPK